MTSKIIEYARLLRLPGLGGLSVAPVFGALSTGHVVLSDIVILFVIGALSSIYGFVLNDIIDVNVDKLSKDLMNRPLVKGEISLKTAQLICLLSFTLAFVLIFIFFFETTISFGLALFAIIGSAVTGSLYNIYGKRIVGSDVLVALSEALLVLFGALVVAPLNSMTIFTGIITILTFNQLLYMNAVEGGLKDADHDYLLNVKNIALKSGVIVNPSGTLHVPKSFQLFGIGIRLISIILVFSPFIFFNYPIELWNLVVLILFMLGVLLASEKMLWMKTFKRNKIRKLIIVQTFLRYSLVPLMLIPLVGGQWSLTLIFLPFIWYILFTPLIRGKLFTPEM